MVKKYAYCTLLMKGDDYLPGALVMGYLLCHVAKSKHDIIIMVTPDVSKKAKKALNEVFDYVIRVPYITYKTFRVFHRDDIKTDRYDSWIGSSYTKWNLLKFIQYEKIFFLDADTITIRNIDEVFNFETPAGVFKESTVLTNFHNKIKFGKKMPSKLLIKSLNNRGVVASGTAVLIKPNKTDFKNYIKMLDNFVKKSKRGFGFNSTNGADEQSIAYYYYLKATQGDTPYTPTTKPKQTTVLKHKCTLWTILPNNLNTTPWKLSQLRIPSNRTMSTSRKKIKNNLIICQIPHVIHYIGKENVWDMSPKKYDDIKVWWLINYNYLQEFYVSLNELSSTNKHNINSNNLNYNEDLIGDKEVTVDPICFWCKYLNKKFNNESITFDHHIIDKKNKLTCPRLICDIKNSYY